MFFPYFDPYLHIIIKKMKLVLFDLDDTLFDGDTEGEWVTYMDNKGLINNPIFFSPDGKL